MRFRDQAASVDRLNRPARDQRSGDIVVFLFAVLLLLAAWEFLPPLLGLQSYIFPRLTDITSTFASNTDILLPAAESTLLEGVVGVLIGGASGFVLAIGLYHIPPMRRGMLTLMLALNTTPTVGLAPVAVILLGSGLTSKIVLIAFLTSFTLLLYTLQGLDIVPANEERLLESFGMSKWAIFRQLRMRYALPSIMTGVRFAASQAIITAIVVEIFSSSGGLGHLILLETSLGGYVVMWAAACEGAILGLALYGIATLAERRATWWVG